jgi:hypothetical protein
VIRFIRRMAAAFRGPTVRVWQLGSMEHKVFPTEKAVDALRDMLLAMTNGEVEVTDIIWGPELTVTELVGDGDPEIVTGPGIRITREGRVVKVEREDAPAA